MHNFTTTDLRAALRNGKYAWPGGYPCYFIAADGEAMSFETVRDNYRLIVRSMRYGFSDDWSVIGCEVN